MKFEKLFAELNRRRAKYMVVGGVAVNLCGIARATADIDIVIALDAGNVCI